MAVLKKVQEMMGGEETRRLKYDKLTMSEYNGEGDIREWLESYERQSNLLEWDGNKKLRGLPMFLGKKVKISCEHAQKLHSKAMEGKGKIFRKERCKGCPKVATPPRSRV